MKIYIVLKTGEFYNRKRKIEFPIQYIDWFHRMCQIHAPNIPLVCLTNDTATLSNAEMLNRNGLEIVPLIHNYPGWWSKLEIFYHQNVFYMDLDTVLIKNIESIISSLDDSRFYALDNLSGHRDPTSNKLIMGSGIMAWKNVDMSFLVKEFHPSMMDSFKELPLKWGDQGYIWWKINKNFHSLQRRFPNEIYSYKFDKIDYDNPSGSIIVFHGNPKPHEVQHNWILPF
jgi:hypothetical protein